MMMQRAFCLLVLLSTAAPGEDLATRLDRLAASANDSLIAIRRQIHANPELSNREFETSKLVADTLRSYGLEPQTGVAKTGVVALIRGAKPGPCVLLRADMDALPIDEPNDVPYLSKNPGVKHACGHDLHTAILLGAARVLSQMRGDLHGSVKLVFQPSEEGAPAGEEGGAELMVKEGVLKDPPVDTAFALHVDPRIDAGFVAVRGGSDMANADSFEIVINGQRAHGAWPHLGVDPIPIAAQVVLELQAMMTRTQDASHPAVVSVCQIDGGNRFNILAGSVRLGGTVRTLDAAQRESIRGRMEKIVRSACEGFDATYTFDYKLAAPMLVNDPALARRVRGIFERHLGPDHVLDSAPQMTAEDFAYVTAAVPSVYYHLGVRNESRGFTHALHSELFDADESAIAIGVRTMCALALELPAGRK